MKEIKIQCNTGSSLPLDAFIEFQGDLKELSKENYQKLKKEIEKTGFAFAPHVWKSKKDNKIAFYLIDGHQRIRTLRQMVKEGYECGEIPVVMVEAASMKEAKRRVLQGTSQYGRMTNDGLYEFVSESELEFQDVEDSFRLPDINFVDFKDEFLDDPKIDEAADEVPELRPDPKVKLGDLFILGNHRLLCGDSTNAAQVEKLMNGEKADMVFTDPPYGMRLDAGYEHMKNKGSGSGNLIGTKGNTYRNVIGDHEDFSPKLIETIFNNFNYCKEIFVWGMDYFAELIPNRNQGNPIVWDKRTSESQDKGFGSCFELCWSKQKHKRYIARIMWAGFFGGVNSDKDETKSRIHPTQKPVQLAEWFFDKWGDKTKSVVDLYGGSGSTLIACEKTNRKCFMMELDPQYCQVIIERWQKYTNKEAVREDGVKFNALLLQD